MAAVVNDYDIEGVTHSMYIERVIPIPVYYIYANTLYYLESQVGYLLFACFGKLA